MSLSAEELLAGSALTHELEVPEKYLSRDAGGKIDSRIILRPLTVRDLQRISKAARDDDSLSAALMIQLAVVEPELKLDDVSKMPAGMARFLVERINDISGLAEPGDSLAELVQAPLARACFTLAKEFGWTPEEVSGMTIGQILLYLEMARRDGKTQ